MYLLKKTRQEDYKRKIDIVIREVIYVYCNKNNLKVAFQSNSHHLYLDDLENEKAIKKIKLKSINIKIGLWEFKNLINLMAVFAKRASLLFQSQAFEEKKLKNTLIPGKNK